jgi:hypothetical protein
MILVAKYADHQPLNRQSGQFDREAIELPYRRWPIKSARARRPQLDELAAAAGGKSSGADAAL